jgi:hypothetical protein
VLTEELVCVQFRKVLELIAFSSLCANKQKYAEAHKNFGEHWRAKNMLDVIRKLNEDFYPAPVIVGPSPNPAVKFHLADSKEAFLTESEFVELYDLSSDVLHMRNPFSTRNPMVTSRHTVGQWVQRIQNLLKSHMIRLVDRDRVWIVTIPAQGEIHAAHAQTVTVQPS